MSDVEKYHAHLGECALCAEIEDGLCPEGMELIYECREDLDSDEQQFARRVFYRAVRQQEADENFRFYATSEEPCASKR